MAFPWSAVISAGGSLLGGLVSGFGAERASQRSEDFSREMYEYALTHGPSLEMQGLRAAGINPMLRYGTGGQGTPVSMPTQSFPNTFGALGDAISGGTASALGAMTSEQSMAESRQRVRNLDAELPRIGAEVLRIHADTSLTYQQRENAVAEQGRILQQTALGLADEYLRYAQSNLSEAQAASASAMTRLLGQQFTTEEYRSLTEMYTAALRRSQAEVGATEADIADLDQQIYRGVFGRWLRETFLTRAATGSSVGGMIGGAAAEAGHAVNDFMEWYEDATAGAAREVFRWFE